MTKQLNMEAGKALIEAVNRITQLAKLDKLDANGEAEEAGLMDYVRNQMFDHCGHLLGCWFAVATEYEPLCNAFASIANRAAAIQAQRAQLNTPEPKQEESAIVTPEEPAPLIAPEGTPMILKPEFRRGTKR